MVNKGIKANAVFWGAPIFIKNLCYALSPGNHFNLFLAFVTRALEKLRGKTHVRLFSSPDRSSVYLEGPSLILFI